MRTPLFLALALLTLSCAPPKTSEEGSRLTSGISDALSKKDLDQFGSLIADDAVIMAADPVGHVLRGKDQILEFYRTNLPNWELSLSFTEEKFQSAGKEAIQRGSIGGEITVTADRVKLPQNGEFLHVLRQTSNGTWVLWHGIWNFGHPGIVGKTRGCATGESCCCVTVSGCDCVTRPSTGCPKERPMPVTGV
jgi:ketosteroid isomerase-like protein